LPKPICEFLFRATDNNGQGIPGARIEFPKTHYSAVSADKFGRIYFRQVAEHEREVKVTAPGYQTARVKILCTRRTPTIEKRVVLQGARLPSPSTDTKDSP